MFTKGTQRVSPRNEKEITGLPNPFVDTVFVEDVFASE